MNTHADKTTETKSNAVSNGVTVQQSAEQQLTDNRPEAIAQRKIQEAANNSRQVKQLRNLQQMVNNSRQAKKAGTVSNEKTIQGYFLLFGKKTNDLEEFPEVDKADLWENLKVEFGKLALEGPFLEEYKKYIMGWARESGKYTFEAAKTFLAGMAASKVKGEQPMSTTSPTGMTSVVPELLGDKEKHTTAKYTFADESEESGKASATFDLDKYTKKGESDLAAGTWLKKNIQLAIELWTLKAPLVQHLAQFVLPKLAKTDRKWEMYLREMERVLTERIAEAKNREFSIKSKDLTKTVGFVRRNFEQAARAKVQEKLLAGTAPPASQNDIPFFDDLIRAELKKEGVKNWYTTEPGTQLEFDNSKIDQNPGMTLVHWRTILLFDWQAGHEVLKNAKV